MWNSQERNCNRELLAARYRRARHQPLAAYEAAVKRVGLRGRLAGASRRIVRERNPKRPTFARIELMYLAGHAGRHHPRRDRARIEKRTLDCRAGRVHMDIDSGRGHART